MRGSIAIVASLLSPALAACYLPVKYTEPASPKLIGVYRRADGSPASRARLAVTSHQGDSDCAHASTRVTADSMGRFVLEIGRASCRERVSISVGAVAVKKKR